MSDFSVVFIPSWPHIHFAFSSIPRPVIHFFSVFCHHILRLTFVLMYTACTEIWTLDLEIKSFLLYQTKLYRRFPGFILQCAWRDSNSINRNIVECKVKNCEMKRLYVHCINRNIVECKVEVYNVADLVRLRINRNIVECKDSFFDCPLVPLLVLIETLWNVKSVETGINRNIVECKVGIALTCLECSG